LRIAPLPQPNTFPATADTLLSLVTVFLRPFPACISPSKAPTPPPPAGRAGAGIGGGGGTSPGAALFGNGGGGGADEPGIGGGGGGAAGAPELGNGGAGGAPDGPESKAPGIAGAASCTGVAGLLSMADNGLGGAMVPKRIDARCFADPPVGASSPSSLESSLSDSALDQSSSSGRRRD
jgi:hypothetical protein